MEKYYVVNMDDDGDVHFDVFNKEELEKSLENNDWGEVEFASSLPKYGLDGGKLYIIKGEMITPKPVTRITSYEV